jgi:hypothetical protein
MLHSEFDEKLNKHDLDFAALDKDSWHRATLFLTKGSSPG